MDEPRRRLQVLDREVAARCERTAQAFGPWPCAAGCDACCRSLAAVPELTASEWQRVREAILALTRSERAAVAHAIERRMALGNERPIACPLLDPDRGLCRVYEARPIACRTYGFYADRDGVLGCERIAAVAERESDVVWGHHDAVIGVVATLGEARSLLEWFADDPTVRTVRSR